MPAWMPTEARKVLDRLQDVTPEGQSFSAGYTVECFQPGSVPDLDGAAAVDQAMYGPREPVASARQRRRPPTSGSSTSPPAPMPTSSSTSTSPPPAST